MTTDSAYTFKKVLGSGSFGTTWLATDKRTKTNVAIKMFVTERTEPSDQAKSIESWKWEIDMIRKLLDACQPYAICIVNAYIENRVPRLVMEYVDGETLHSMIQKWPRRRKPNPIHDLIKGIRIIHKYGVVHEDIKELNVMWDRKLKHYRFIDFGLACTTDYLGEGGHLDPAVARFPCGTRGTGWIASPDMEAVRTKPATFTWEMLQGHDYWAIGLLGLRWETLDPRVGMYYYNEYSHYLGGSKITRRMISELNLDSERPFYYLLEPGFIRQEIDKIKDDKVREMVGLLLVFDGEERMRNVEMIECV